MGIYRFKQSIFALFFSDFVEQEKNGEAREALYLVILSSGLIPATSN